MRYFHSWFVYPECTVALETFFLDSNRHFRKLCAKDDLCTTLICVILVAVFTEKATICIGIFHIQILGVRYC